MLLSWGNANESCSSVYLTYIFHQRRSPWVAAVTDLECRSSEEVRWALVNFRQGLTELWALFFELLRRANVAYCLMDLLGCQGTFLERSTPQLWEHNECILEFLLFVVGTDTHTRRARIPQKAPKSLVAIISSLQTRVGHHLNSNDSDSTSDFSSSFWFRFKMIHDSDSLKGSGTKVLHELAST